MAEPQTAKAAVIDASPLIFLARSRHLDLLRHFAREVWVPEPVAGEILQRGIQDITAQAIENTPWLVTRTAPEIPAAILNIPVRGTLGIVLAAKQRGLIPKARPIIEDMMTAGLYLSRKVLDQALSRVGE